MCNYGFTDVFSMCLLISDCRGMGDLIKESPYGMQEIQVADKLHGIFKHSVLFKMLPQAFFGCTKSEKQLAKRHSLFGSLHADASVFLLNVRLILR